MSTKVSALCWKIPLSAHQKLVLVRLAAYADHDGGSIFPAIATVAEDCGISPRQVQYILKAFVKNDLLMIVGNETGGRGRTRHYAIDLERAAEMARSGPAQTVQRVQEPCTHSSPEETVQRVQRVQTDAEKGAQALHPTRQESVKEAERGDAGDVREASAAQSATDARGIIAAFDAARVAAFGVDQARAYPAAKDCVFARRWLAAGADLDLCCGVFAARMQRSRAGGRPPPDTLEYFDRAVADAIAALNAPVPQGNASNVQHFPASRPEKRNGAAAYLDRLLAESGRNAG
jgi:Helix-turn-helix domain